MISIRTFASLLLVTMLVAAGSVQNTDYEYAFVIPGLSLPSQYNWEMYPTLESNNPSWIIDMLNIFEYPSYGKAVFFETRSSTIKKYTIRDGDKNSIKKSSSLYGKILKQNQKQIYASQQVLKHFFSLFEFDGTSGKFGVIQCQGQSRSDMKCLFKNQAGLKQSVLRTQQIFQQEKTTRNLDELVSPNTEKKQETILSFDPLQKYMPDGILRESAKFEKMSFLLENDMINIFQKTRLPLDMLILLLQILLITLIAQVLMKIIIKNAKVNSFVLAQNIIICFLCLADNQKNINIGMLFSQERVRLIYFLPLIYGFLRFMLILFEIMVRKFIDIGQLIKLTTFNIVLAIVLFNSSLLLLLSSTCLLFSLLFNWGHSSFRFKHKYPTNLFWITAVIHCKYLANRYYYNFGDPMFLLIVFSISTIVFLEYYFLKCVVGSKVDPHQIDLIPINSKGVKQENQQCSICLLPIEQQGQQKLMARTPCKHIFHSHCLKEWLKMKNQCPIDRNYIYCPSWQDDFERDFVRRLIEVEPNITAHIVRSLSQNSNSSQETEDQLQNQNEPSSEPMEEN